MAAETDTKEHGFTIEGRIYEEPETLTTGEHRIIKRYTGFNFRQLAEQAEEGGFADQDMIAASAHIAYRREHPDKTFEQIEAIVDAQDFDTMLESLDEGTDAADPPALTNTPDESSPPKKSSSNETSGPDSNPSSDRSEETPENTGTSESDTSSLRLARTTLAT